MADKVEKIVMELEDKLEKMSMNPGTEMWEIEAMEEKVRKWKAFQKALEGA